ncbi:MAG TPA: ISNCY family transposase [Candidatus Binatia bacterium]|jgi:IS5 family transposase
MITVRYQQRTIYEPLAVNLLPDYKELLWEGWLLKVDKFLEDEDLVKIVREALEKRHPNSRTRGRLGTPAEVVLRLMALKHLRNWSYQALEREVRANVVYREFTRIRGEKVPDSKTMVRWGKALGPKVTRAIHERVVDLGHKRGVVRGRKLRVDTTVAETDIHYPTDSGLLGDVVRVMTRTMKQIHREVGEVGTRPRDRSRSVKHRLIEIGRSAMRKSEEAVARRTEAYRKLMATTQKVMGQAKLFSQEVAAGVKRALTLRGQLLIEGLATYLEEMRRLAMRVLKQTKARVLEGNQHYPDKLYSVFEVHTEAIRKGKLSKPTEFGKLVKIQEAEHQIITDYEVFLVRPADQELLIPAIEKHREIFGRVPQLAATDAGFFSLENVRQAKELGVKRVAVPNRKGRNPARSKEQKQRWFRRAQRWRVGCEGRISVLKRRQGLRRCRYRGMDGMERWVGWAVIADNLIHLGRLLPKQG